MKRDVETRLRARGPCLDPTDYPDLHTEGCIHAVRFAEN